jgi:hypothetical protein
VQIEIRSTDRLRGKTPVDLGAILNALAGAARDSEIDLARLRVVCDWVQYRQNFREAVSLRAVLPSALQSAGASDSFELALDMRRANPETLPASIASVLARAAGKGPGGQQYLEDWRPGSSSCIWDFNGLYWNYLGLWEQATGREYEQALPGGESDARNSEMAREIILELFRVWDGLAARHALPEDLHVLELGVGNGNQARVWLDEFVKLDREMQRDYYRRLHYLMADYSQHVLDRARETVGPHTDRCSSLAFDARHSTKTLGFLRGKTFLIYISNVYDNLPTDEIVRIGGHLYRVEVRAYFPAAQAAKLAEGMGVSVDLLPQLTQRLLQLGPDLLSRSDQQHFPEGVMQAVNFWKSAWEAVRLEERYVPLEGLDAYRIAEDVGGEVLRPLVEANGDIRMQISNGAAASFVDSLPLLHPFGILQCLDIFVTDLAQYHTFRGPGKYDGSVVNWVNGPLLAAVGRRKGYDVHYASFQRTGSNIQTLTARIQE